MDTTQATAAKVLAAIDAAERPRAWVGKKAGIALTTFSRKLEGVGDFTVSEIGRLARALNLPPVALLPDEFVDENEPAA